jgi:hypothetical protein
LLHRQCQALHGFAHIGAAHRDSNTRTRRDHRSARITAAAKTGDAEAKIETRLPRARSMTISGATFDGAVPAFSTSTALAS